MGMPLMGFSALMAFVFVGAACGDRTHLSDSHGRAYRQVIHAQASDPNAGTKPKPVADLDSQDAGTIAKVYRQGMAGKQAAAADQPLILVAPKTNRSGDLPPPSIPEGEK